MASRNLSFVWSGVVKLVISARRAFGRSRELMLACGLGLTRGAR